MKRKIWVVTLSLLLLFVSVSTVNAFTGNEKVDWLIENGYVQGDSKGYRLNDNITRAEATKMVVEASGLGQDVPGYRNFVSMFKDMSKNQWANGYVNVAVINQLVNGYPDGSFKPSNNITYAEIIKMLVMAKGDIPKTEGYTGPYWAIPYIVKADNIGITDGVIIRDHYENANREKVFELVYNTMFKENSLVLEEYKGIIVENERTARLNKDEISIVIFEELNSSSKSTMRYKQNDKVKITLPREVEDVEYLFGKVVDITIDNNNIVKDVYVDESYSYLDGPILAGEYDVYLGTNGRYYDVNLKDTSRNRVDRILGVYHNDSNYDYEEFVYDLGEYNSSMGHVFLAEYARITVKGGVVYFIDSYTFSDIAPVSHISRNGSEVYIYNDSNEAIVTDVKIYNSLGYTIDWGIETMKVQDIKAGDVLHIYNRNSVLVRRDSRKQGKFYGLIEDTGYYFADIDGYEYQVRVTENRRPIYSLDGKEFKTLYADDPFDDLSELMFKDIRYLLDINGHIQSIEGYAK